MSAVPKIRLVHAASEAPRAPGAASMPPPAAAPAPSGEAVLVDVVVLTADLELFQSIREAVGERNPVWRARSAEEAADLLITGRCGVLLIDLACVSTRADTLIEQIVDQFPDVVVCVAGTRQDEPILATLISDGLVYRFMHKPATARRAGMFLQAAIRRHVERRGDTSPEATLLLLRALGRPRGLKLNYLALLGVVGLALTLPLFVGHGPTAPPDTSAAPAPAEAPPAMVDTSPRSDPVLSRARAALQAGRLEAPQGRNALDLFAAVLLAQPDNVEARAGLERTVALLLERAEREAADGRKAAAERLVQRVLAVAPEDAEARKLAERLNPPDTPSQQLAREQRGTAMPVARTIAPETVNEVTPARARSTSLPATVPVTKLPEPVTKLTSSAPKPAPTPVVRPDPLAPRYVSDPRRIDTLDRPRNYGGTVAATLPIAGTAQGSAGATAAPSTDEPAPIELLHVPADELERISARDPVYPVEALRQRLRGSVELEFTITPSGAVRDIQVVNAEPRGVFDAAATEALAQWRFRPRFVNGQAVAQRSTVTMRFDVDE